jgi:PAS domain S-box-containing protein
MYNIPHQILYVDDEESLLDIGKQYLERTKEFVVDTAESVLEALDHMGNFGYDAVISDYDMPDQDGISFLRKLRSSGNDIPFIIFTGRGREEVVIEAINNGVDFYLQKGGQLKPTYAELSHKLKIAIERRNAIKMVHQSKQQLSDIIANLPDSVFAINSEHEVIAWNRAIEKLVGLSADQMIGIGEYGYAIPFHGKKTPTLIDLVVHPDPEIEKTYPEFLREGDIITGELLCHLQGFDRYIRVRASPLYSMDNAISGAIATIRDITSYKLAELQTQNQIEFYRTVAAHSADWEYWEGPKRQILFCSPSSKILTGYNDEEIKSDPSIIHRLIHPDDQKQWKKHRSGCKCSNEDHQETFRIITRKGETRWIDHLCKPVYGGNGEYLGHLVSNRDISRQKETEQALVQRERQFRNIFENAILGIFQTTPEGRIIEVNSALAKMYGYDSPAAMKEEISDIKMQIYEKPQERVQILETLRISGEIKGYETVHLRRDGTSISISLNMIPVNDDEGTLLWYEGMIEDITERKKIQNELEETIIQLSVAHEELLASNDEIQEQYRQLAKSEQALRMSEGI